MKTLFEELKDPPLLISAKASQGETSLMKQKDTYVCLPPGV